MQCNILMKEYCLHMLNIIYVCIVSVLKQLLFLLLSMIVSPVL